VARRLDEVDPKPPTLADEIMRALSVVDGGVKTAMK